MSRLRNTILRAVAKPYLRRQVQGGRTQTVRAVFLGDFVSSKIILDGIYEGRELDVLAREVFPACSGKSIALDVGANIGNHTTFFAQHFSRVIAFEPNPRVAALLRVNTTELGGAVEVVQAGLSDASGKLNFRVHDSNLGASRITGENTGMTVEVRTLDEMAGELKIDSLDFVKIDVEGHEDKVLAGARGLLTAGGPIVALEGFYKADPEKGACVFDLLCEFGYRRFYSLSNRPIGVPRALDYMTPKLLRRRRPLRLEQIEEVTATGEDHSLMIAAKWVI